LGLGARLRPGAGQQKRQHCRECKRVLHQIRIGMITAV
jgi:hypothetical protein